LTTNPSNNARAIYTRVTNHF